MEIIRIHCQGLHHYCSWHYSGELCRHSCGHTSDPMQTSDKAKAHSSIICFIWQLLFVVSWACSLWKWRMLNLHYLCLKWGLFYVAHLKLLHRAMIRSCYLSILFAFHTSFITFTTLLSVFQRTSNRGLTTPSLSRLQMWGAKQGYRLKTLLFYLFFIWLRLV